MFSSSGEPLQLTNLPLDSLSGKGYRYFNTLGSLATDKAFFMDFHLGIDDTHMRMFMPEGEERIVYQLNSLFNHRYYESSLRKLPVPALLVRQQGEAWNKPFVVVYEPYGNGAEANIKSVYVGKTVAQEGVAKLTVEHKKSGRIDYIIHSIVPEKEADYMGIRFKGTYCVVSFDGDLLLSIYVGNGKSLSMNGLTVNSVSGEAFNALFELRNGVLSYNSDKEVIYSLTKNE